MILSIITLVALLFIVGFLFIKFYPSFGGDVSEERQLLYSSSKQFEKGLFRNTRDVQLDFSFSQTLKISRKFFFEKVEKGRPESDLSVHELDSTNVADYNSDSRLVWFGHSAFLFQTNGKTILIDPMFGQVPAPHPWFGSKRFSKNLPLEVEKLPKIDVLLISHDHYDHLDYGSIKKLKDKVEKFIVPLGVGVHLEAWGIEADRIEELDWWQETNYDNISYVCTPAQHFSGRKLNNGQSTLWSSWVIKTDSTNLFFSGDSGYGPHFTEIGEKYGPFDLAMMECGQYNKMWPDIHMFPEQTAQAGVDVNAKVVMPIHWGAFKLALHSWTDPVERVEAKAKELGIPLLVPEIGETINYPFLPEGDSDWWRSN